MKIKWHLETGMQGADLTGEIDVDDDTSDAEIEEQVKEDMWNFLSLTWSRQDLD